MRRQLRARVRRLMAEIKTRVWCHTSVEPLAIRGQIDRSQSEFRFLYISHYCDQFSTTIDIDTYITISMFSTPAKKRSGNVRFGNMETESTLSKESFFSSLQLSRHICFFHFRLRIVLSEIALQHIICEENMRLTDWRSAVVNSWKSKRNSPEKTRQQQQQAD